MRRNKLLLATAIVLLAEYAPAPEEDVMTLDYTLAGIVTIGLLIYLTYALLRPDRF